MIWQYTYIYICYLSMLFINLFLQQHIMIVQRQMSVVEEEIEEFRLALKQYVESASAQGGCLQ